MKKLLFILLCVTLTFSCVNNEGNGVYKKDPLQTIDTTFKSGDNYVGEWKNGKPNGKGTYTYDNGEIYEGDHKNGLRNGSGIYTFLNGNGYWSGEFKDGKLHGKGISCIGKFEWSGEFKDGKLPEGTLSFNGIGIYVGELKDGKMHGKGKMTYADGTVKEGLFENGRFIGE